MIDHTSRWLEVVPQAGMKVATCADTFISRWVSRFSVPVHLPSDQCRQFTSTLWSNVCHQLGIAHITTTGYHLQANGMGKQSHCQLKDTLKSCLAGPAWPDHLPWVLLGIRTVPNEDTAVSAAEKLYGAPLVLPAQLATNLETPLQPLVNKLRTSATFPVRRNHLEPPSSPPPVLVSADMAYICLQGRGPSTPDAAVCRPLQSVSV